jgi:hypothetical protein
VGVTIVAPPGYQASASRDGMFQRTEIRRPRQMSVGGADEFGRVI